MGKRTIKLIIIPLVAMIFLSGCTKNNDNPSSSKSNSSSISENSNNSSHISSTPNSSETLGNENNNTSIPKGSIEGNIYKNEHFGLTITLPETYYVLNENEIKNTIQSGNDIIKESDPNTNNDPYIDYYEIFAYKNNPNTQSEENNNSFIASIQPLGSFKDVNSYVESLKTGLLNTGLSYSIDDPVIKTINGKDFTKVHTEVPVNDVKLNQNYYIILEKNYIISFITSYVEDDDVLNSIIENISME